MPACPSRSATAFRTALLLAAAFVAAPAAAQVTFPVAFDASANGLTPDERARLTTHLQEAGRRWMALLDVTGPRSIELLVRVDDGIATANASSTTTAFVRRIEGRDTFEPGAAHELLTGIDPNGATADVQIAISSIYLRNELWFDPSPATRTATVPSDRTDAMSVALHELGHALAYNGWADGNGVPPATFWSPYDSWIVPGDPSTPPLFGGPHAIAAWGSPPELTRGNIAHWGNADALQSGIAQKDATTAPHTICVLPMSQDAPPSRDRARDRGAKVEVASLIDELMNGVVFYRGTRYDISPLDRALLIDVGLLADDGLFASGFEGD